MKNFFKYSVGRNVKVVKILFINLIAFTLFVLAINLYAPFHNLKQFNAQYSDSLKFSEEERLAFKNDEFFELKKHEAYLKSRLLASGSDSITLSINVEDSLVSIEIQGFILHQVKMKKIKRSYFFERAKRESVINFIETPLNVTNNIASIKKEPVIFKKAPKDTIEAASQIAKLDTINNEKVFVSYILDRNLNIEMIQCEQKAGFGYLKYNMHWKIERLKMSIKYLLNFKIPVYTPAIRLELSKEDIMSIYRALPKHAIVSIKI